MDEISPTGPGLHGTVVLSQRWSELLFIHWRADAAEIAPLLPQGIVPDQFDGSTWVGLIPFRMSATKVLGRIPVPYFGDFVEVNVRLYGVDESGRRGVVFLSLEASRLAAVLGARAAFSLPYMWAKASMRRTGDVVGYRTSRVGVPTASAKISARIFDERVTDDALAHFLSARWWLFESCRGRTIAMPNDHEPWPLQRAELLELEDGLIHASGITSIGTRKPDSVLYSQGVITRFGSPETIRE